MQSAATQIPLFPAEERAADPADGFSVRESGRARRMSIKVYPRGKVEVVVPRRTRARDVEAFVAEHRDWIARTRAAFAEEHPPEPFRLPETVSLPAVGRVVRVRYVARPGASGVRHRFRDNVLTLSGLVDDVEQCVRALRRWLSALARTELQPRLEALAAATGNAYRKIRIAGQKTCWGSHSSSGTISLNYCLLFLRPELVRYLMVHELCHGRHMNHSRRFWAYVARFEPGYRSLDRELSSSWKAIPTWVGIY